MTKKITAQFHTHEKTSVFIDGSNLFATAKMLDFDLDYKKLLNWVKQRSLFVGAYYYTALIEDQDYSPVRPLVDWLDYNGFTIVTKPTKEFVNEHGQRKIRSNMDIELAVDMMEIASHVDHIILFSGNGDFRRLVEAVQKKGRRVTVVSTMKTSPPMVADELRRQANDFIDLTDLMELIGRENANEDMPKAKTGS